MSESRSLPEPRRDDEPSEEELERASWQDWQRTFNDRVLANLFGRRPETSS